MPVIKNPLSRRAVLASALLAAAPEFARAQSSGWSSFKERFVSPSGRVVDSGQGGLSHSEGQAWGLFLAARNQDLEGFQLILRWTRQHMARRGDALLPWRFEPIGQRGMITDHNNATDADLYHGWALVEAHRRWPGRGYDAEARAVARDILGSLTRRVGERLLLLPGAWGFETREAVQLNPSYVVLEAFPALNSVLPDPRWATLAADGEHLIGLCRFGPLGLPADWVRLDLATRQPGPAHFRPHRFGQDALRVPLHLLWARRDHHVALQGVRQLWAGDPTAAIPAWVDLRRQLAAPFPAGSGAQAIRALLLGSAAPPSRGGMPDAVAAGNYYDAALCLLAQEAHVDRSWGSQARQGRLV